MTDPSDEVAFWLQLRRGLDGRRWFVVPLRMSDEVTLALVPNTIASRSVITPSASELLRAEGLVGANIYDIQTGDASCVLAGCRLGDQLIPDLEACVRDVAQLRDPGGTYPVDGYLGLDFLFGLCTSLANETRTLQMRLRLKR